MSYIAELPYVGWVLPFLVVLGVVVFVHEYGHYIVGRWCGIRAEIFSIGFGPELYHWVDKRGMRWRIGALPLGGYVKFAGDMNAASAGADRTALDAMSDEERAGAFHLASLWRRAATVVAGPVANFILSIVVFAAIAMASGKELNEPVIGSVNDEARADLGFIEGDRVVSVGNTELESFNDLLEALTATNGEATTALVMRDGQMTSVPVTYRFLTPARIDSVLPGGAAADAGLKAGDVVIAIGGEAIDSFDGLREAVLASGGKTIVLSIARSEDRLTVDVTPQVVDVENDQGEMIKRSMIGVTTSSYRGVEPVVTTANPIDSVVYGAVRTWGIIDGTMSFLHRIIFGDADASMLGGPIQIAKVSGQAAEQGLVSLFTMIALISTSIGLLNLFPIPVLDGGHLVFYAFEALTGRPIRERWQEIGNGLGLSMILLLMVFATYNDLLR